MNPRRDWSAAMAGGHSANRQDMLAKGRQGDTSNPGERNPRHKLTEAQVLEIRARLQSGARRLDLAAEFGVSRSAIRLIGTGRNWSHLPAAAGRCDRAARIVREMAGGGA